MGKKSNQAEQESGTVGGKKLKPGKILGIIILSVLLVILIPVISGIVSGVKQVKEWNDAVDATLSEIKSGGVNYTYQTHATLTEPGGSPVATDIEYHIDGYAYKIVSPADGVEYRVYEDGKLVRYTYNESSGKYSKSTAAATEEAFLKERNDIADKSGITGIIASLKNTAGLFEEKDGEYFLNNEKAGEEFKKGFVSGLAASGDVDFDSENFVFSLKFEENKLTKIYLKLKYTVEGQGLWDMEIQWTLGGATVEIPTDSEIETI
ncbi:MAG: hypothetical protein LBP62_05370 [Clostridiales bacterium]|nr:hypothetical protein [Clostridiales bacterium]